MFFKVTILGFMCKKSTLNKTFKNFCKSSQNRDWAIVVRISFISFFVNGNDFGAGTVFRKNDIYKSELDEA